VGLIDVKSSPVQFHVQRKTSFSTLNTPIPFEIERLNVGRAMDLASGIFTAPKAGIYYFVFSCLKQPSTTYMSVFLRLNGVNIGRGHGSNLFYWLNWPINNKYIKVWVYYFVIILIVPFTHRSFTFVLV